MNKKIYFRKWYLKNRERVIEKARLYRLGHKEEKRKYDRAYFAKNKKRLIEQNKKWINAHPEKRIEYQKRYISKVTQKCSAENCDKIRRTKSLCPAHYLMLLRRGTTERSIGKRGEGHIKRNGYKEYGINGKTKYEHRLVIEKHLLRKLSKDEVVHHVNHNKLDNRISNLRIMTRAEHMRLHKKHG